VKERKNKNTHVVISINEIVLGCFSQSFERGETRQCYRDGGMSRFGKQTSFAVLFLKKCIFFFVSKAAAAAGSREKETADRNSELEGDNGERERERDRERERESEREKERE
jgi:hypothetical protein